MALFDLFLCMVFRKKEPSTGLFDAKQTLY
jgi:hypothetical protein